MPRIRRFSATFFFELILLAHLMGMQRTFSPGEAKGRKWLVVLLTLVCLVVYAAYGAAAPRIFTPDGGRDIDFAKTLLSLNLNPLAYLDATADGMPQPGIQYLAYVYLLVFCWKIGGDNWLEILIVLNVFFYTLSSFLMFFFVGKILNRKCIIVFTFLCTILCFEYFQWIPQSQSEGIYLLLVTLMFFVVLAGSTTGSATVARSCWILSAVLAILIFFVRPTSLPIIAFVMIAYGVHSIIAVREARQTASVMLFVLLVGAFIGGLGVLGGSFLLHDPMLLPAGKVRDVFEIYRGYHLGGEVLSTRPETFMVVQDSVWDFAKVSFARIAYFFVFWAQGFSTVHNVVNFLFFPILYIFVALGVFAGFSSGINERNNLQLSVVFLSVMMIMLVAAFHAVTVLDYNWRYRLPAYPALFLLAAQGASWFMDKMISYRKRSSATNIFAS